VLVRRLFHVIMLQYLNLIVKPLLPQVQIILLTIRAKELRFSQKDTLRGKNRGQNSTCS